MQLNQVSSPVSCISPVMLEDLQLYLKYIYFV